jgi:protein KRI1
VANDFGLEVDEILNAKDSELNTWASLKKAVAYRPIKDELSDVRSYKDRSKNIEKKKKILSTVYNPEPESDENDEEEREKETLDTQEMNNTKKNDENHEINVQAVEESSKESIKKKKTKKQKDNVAELVEGEQEPLVKRQKTNNEKQIMNKKNKKTLLETINDDRLKAFGINPKKFHKKIKYSSNQNKK